MPTCSQNKKCTQNRIKCHRVPISPRPCIDSHRIPHFNPQFRSPRCHNPFIHSHYPNAAHCMASVKKRYDCSDESEDEEAKEKVEIIQCPYTGSTQDVECQDENTKLKTCCVRDVDSKGSLKILPSGFKAHISVDIASDQQPSVGQKPEVCCRAKKSIENVSNEKQSPKETSTPKSNQQDPKNLEPCCAKSMKPFQTKEAQFKLSAQGIIKRDTDSTLVKHIDNEALSLQSVESDDNVSEKPCCASAYPRIKTEPILPPKGISGTARPGYVVNKESPDPIPEEKPSECMIDGGCIHGISSIMPNAKQKKQNTCFCGAKSKKESHVCDASKRLIDQKSCPCRYPPGYSQFSCAGNITGVCKCNGEFK
ncbi:uncharacterized protein LOC111001814 [Pieris rapae]|uniref:uncharacterized protein LOC111001814 n=1 Tax=Pieris rapae TaxID=64459 RepID=UPI001E27CFF8|nr:uncharacterized protein LOC111001814 [Pieris rapae]